MERAMGTFEKLASIVIGWLDTSQERKCLRKADGGIAPTKLAFMVSEVRVGEVGAMDDEIRIGYAVT